MMQTTSIGTAVLTTPLEYKVDFLTYSRDKAKKEPTYSCRVEISISRQPILQDEKTHGLMLTLHRLPGQQPCICQSHRTPYSITDDTLIIQNDLIN